MNNSETKRTESYEDAHPPLSPATPAEHFFLKLPTTNISAFTVAANLRDNNKRKSGNLSTASINTDSFYSCLDESEFFESREIRSTNLKSPIREIYTEATENSDSELDTLEDTGTPKVTTHPTKIKMAETKTTNEVNAPETTNSEQDLHLDPTQHFYGGFKNVWGLSTTFILTKPFAKATEKVAGKILNMTTGKEFSGVDEELKPKLAEFDSKILNPKISNVVHFVEPYIKKAHSIVHPIAEKVLSPIFKFMKHESIESEKTEESPKETAEGEEKEQPSKSKTSTSGKKRDAEINAPEMTPSPLVQ